jgi:hypothetical protein
MNIRKNGKALKVFAFGTFILFSLVVGWSWSKFLSPPTRVDGQPFTVTVRELATFAADLEGQPVVISGEALDVSWNATSDVLGLRLEDESRGINVSITFENWTGSGMYPVTELANKSTVTIRGTCMYQSEGRIIGDFLHVILPENTYAISLVVLGIICVLLFYYFKIDVKKFLIKIKPGKDQAGNSKV